MRKKALELAILTVFASGSVACGVIEAPAILALEEGSSLDLTLGPDGNNPTHLGTIDLEGGVATLMTAEFSLFDLLFQLPVDGTIEVTDLLFAGTPFSLLGIPSGEVCTIQDPDVESAGTVVIDIFDHQVNNASLEFAMDLATRILVGSPVLSGAFPDGFPLVLSVDSEADLSLLELFALISGDAEGGITITQVVSERIDVQFGPNVIPLGVDGELTLTSVNAFPTGELLDDCIAFLSM